MMFIVGIDVAKRSHEVSIITSEGQTVQRAFSISNNCTGYNCLMEKIRKLTNVRSEIVFAMESTAHYWLALIPIFTRTVTPLSFSIPFRLMLCARCLSARRRLTPRIPCFLHFVPLTFT